MKKINQKGFMLVETLICATFIVGILTFVYIEFTNINESYDDSFKYNNVNSLYLANQARTYLTEQGLLDSNLLTNTNYIEVDFCPNNDTYCTTLKSQLLINKVIYAPWYLGDRDDDGNYLIDNADISDDFKEFIKKVKLIQTGNVIYVEFTDRTYAVLKVI